jgi:hypothetical protein
VAWQRVWAQTRVPVDERDPGEIAEGRYAVLNGTLCLEDMQGRLLATQHVGEGEDAAAVALSH